MPFSRRKLAPIQSEKHETTWSNIAQNASTAVTVDLMEGQTPGNVTTGTECEIGSRITWFYLEFHFSAESITSTKVIHWFIAREPFGTNLSGPSSYYQTDKKFIIKRGMEMLPKDVSTVFKRIIAIRVPRHLQRIGRDDKWIFKYICSSAESINACGIAISRPES